MHQVRKKNSKIQKVREEKVQKLIRDQKKVQNITKML